MPKLIAHRGGSGLRVENTLAAFAHAIDLGADGAELDVHLTHDGQVVVHHDDRLNTDCCRHIDTGWISEGQRLPLAKLTFAELQNYEIGVPRPGSRYAADFDRIEAVDGQKIPLLEDVIALVKCKSPNFILVIEIKTPVLHAQQRPWKSLVGAVLAILKREDFGARSVLCSFDWSALVYAMAQDPSLRTWFTTPPLSWFDEELPPPEDIPSAAAYMESLRKLQRAGDAPWWGGFDPQRFAGGYPEAIASAGGAAWFMYHRDCTAERVGELAARGMESATWSVNLRDPVALRRLLRTDVGAVCVDYPDADFAALSQ